MGRLAEIPRGGKEEPTSEKGCGKDAMTDTATAKPGTEADHTDSALAEDIVALHAQLRRIGRILVVIVCAAPLSRRLRR
jgi:hypothetical protein